MVFQLLFSMPCKIEVFIWARQLEISAILVNVIFTFYLIVGSFLEEKN
jgi:hypothetical protein